MKIVSVEIVSFGKLSGFSCNFNGQVNVVGQNNGFGKTTLASFVRAMLYGVEYRKQNSPYYYKNFQPWNSDGRFGGSMTVQHNGTQYRIERYFSYSKSGQLLSVKDLSTGSSIDTDCPGEYFLGLTAVSYEQSVYIPQETVTVVNNENFEQKLSGMMQGDKQDNNYDKAVERLRNYCKELRAERGRGGTINMLDDQLQQSQMRLRELKGLEITQQQWKEQEKQIAERLQMLNREESKLNSDIASLRAEALSVERTNTDNSRVEQVRTAEQYIKTHDIERIVADKSTLQRVTFYQYQASQSSQKLKKVGIAGIVTLALAVIVAIMLVVLAKYTLLAIPAIAVIVGVVLLIAGRNKQGNKQQHNDNEQLLDSLRKAYDAPSDCSATTLIGILSKLEGQYNSYRAIVDMFGDVNRQQQNQRNDKVAALQRDIATLSSKLDSIRQERDRLLRQSGDLKGRIDTADKDNDSVEVADKIEQLKVAISQAEYKYNVASLARTLLDEARVKLSTAYVPRLASLSSRLLATATGGELTTVTVDNAFNVAITENGQTHSINEYSRGVRELAAFCFRVVLSSTVFGGNVPLLIVDDAFVNLDEQRFDSASRLLQSMAKQGTQVIYMTCHQRSKRVFAKSID